MTPAATALVVVDLQREYVRADPPPFDVAGLLTAVGGLLDAARAAGALVVHVRDVGTADPRFPAVGPGRDLVLPVVPTDVVLDKQDDDPFATTALARHLRAHRTVVVAGLQSEMCVAATARGALLRGYTVVLPCDAHTTYDVPPGPAGPAVTAAQVRHVAAWSLGDGVHLPPRSAEVAFEPAPPAMA
ncbi:isochorismatase family protein [Nocardioides sp. 1609]|uniref:isochorismatase family protein n=1 Tax=Nocardioides sp. 1609 TaxID=2508327 RepID=UPI00143183C6|nr:isochorismatase family protein [Nocardioides sp. 1609]